jgi:hypothetical protein
MQKKQGKNQNWQAVCLLCKQRNLSAPCGANSKQRRNIMLKKVTMAIALTGLMAGLAYAGATPQTGINGSPHDMNAYTGTHTDDTLKRTCVFCHTPHNAKTLAGAPLWNRTASTLTTPTPYTWQVAQTLGTAVQNPTAGPTALCLSCHDGSIASDSHGSNKAQAGTRTLASGNAGYVRDLTVTHPVGMTYPTNSKIVDKDSGFFIKDDAAISAFDTKNRSGIFGTKTIASVLSGGTIMTCASCHEVHNTTNAKPSSTGTQYNYFLHAQEENSAICLSCHIK